MWTKGRAAGVVVAVVLGLTLVAGAGPAGAAKKAKSCRLLKAAQISEVLGVDVSGPGGAGTLDIACDFDVGAGLGEPGGGILIVQYYERGPIASAVYSAMKDGAEGLEPGERVPGTKVWFTPTTGAWVKKKGQVVNVSLSYTLSDPPAEATQDVVVELVQLAAKRL